MLHDSEVADISVHVAAKEAHREDRENGDDEEVQDEGKQPPMRRQPSEASLTLKNQEYGH